MRRIIADWDYKCPKCKANISVTDKYCASCGLDFNNYIFKATNEKLNEFLDKLPIPLVYWTVFESLIVLFGFLIFSLFLNKIQMHLIKLEIQSLLWINIIFLLFSSLYLFIVPVLLVKKKYKRNLKILGFTKPTSNISYFDVFKLSFFFIIINVINFKFKFDLGILFNNKGTTFDLLLSSNSYKILFFVILVLGIFIPFCEEVFFRGFFFKSLRTKFNFLQAAILSSLIFALLHFDQRLIILSFFAGIILCYLFERYQSIYINTLFHSFVNISFILLSFNDSNWAFYFSWKTIIVSIIVILSIFLIVNIKLTSKIKKSIFSNKYNLINMQVLIFFLFIFLLSSTSFLTNYKPYLSLKTLFFINNNRWNDAEKMINNAFSKYSEDDAELLLMLQTIYYYKGDFKKVMDLSDKLLSFPEVKNSSEQYISIINTTALASIELNEFKKEYYETIKTYLKANPKDYNVLETLAWIEFYNKKYKTAEKMIYNSLENLVNLSKTDLSEIYYHTGMIELKNNNLSKAVYFLQKSFNLGKYNYFADRSMKILLSLKGKENNEM